MNLERPLEAGSAPPAASIAAPFVPPSWEPLRVSHLKPQLTTQDLQLAARQDIYHKFIIFGPAGMEKERILNAMIAVCEPETLLPILARLEEPDKLTFIARCNIIVLEHLVKLGLRIKTPDGYALAIDIVLGFIGINDLPINPQRLIGQALNQRWDGMKKVLNLENFHNDKYVSALYCPFSALRIFFLVIKCCRLRILGMGRDNNKLSIRELNLRNNGIKGIIPFEKIFNYHLTKVDLRNNELKDVNNLRHFKDFKITELWLDGNPLCVQYAASEDYIRAVKNIFPHLQRLDGVLIVVEQKNVPVMQMNYLGDSSRLNLVKQFIKHFFTFYDQDDRIVLNGLYDREALFSTTLGPITNTNHNQMTKAFASNRNLLKFVDYAKCHEFLLRGPEKIIAALRRQPPTYHDYRKFNIDIINQGEGYFILAIQGFFCYKEFPTAPLFFNRTFVIVEAEDNEHCIINDQYHIQSESPGMKSSEIGDPKSVATRIKPNVFSTSEKRQLLDFLRHRTTMNDNYCRKYLDSCNWDIRAALNAFTKAYTVNDVPPEAFERKTHS